MRYREAFSLYRRKMGSGRLVWYYQCYDENGVRVCGHSTGQATKTGAREFCIRLHKEDKLIPTGAGKIPTFGEFAESFWDFENSEYLNYSKTRRQVTRRYADESARRLKSYILDDFKKIPLDKITEGMVDGWLISLASRERKLSEKSVGRKLNSSTCNGVLNVFKMMMGWAVKKHYIKINPAAGVKPLKEETKEREILTRLEVQNLFTAENVWDSELHRLMNKLAACTGMRIGEVIGLKGRYLSDGYLTVAGQYHAKYGYTGTKNHKPRDITIPALISRELQVLKESGGDGFLFSADGGETPVGYEKLRTAFKRALNAIGIGDDEIKRRGLTFHSWRHFFNTTLRLANVADSKVRTVIGHSGQEMTNRYTHFDPKQFTEIQAVQEQLMAGA